MGIISVGIGIPYGGVMNDPASVAFKKRVLAAGGTFEAMRCLNNTVNGLKALDQPATTFNLRVVAAGGTFESINCLQTTIDDLKSITI